MYLKIHETPRGKIIACCDKELIGKVLTGGKKILDLEKYKSFYAGELVDEEKLEKALKNFASVNLIGEKCVGVAKKLDLVTEDDIVELSNVPHVQIYKM